MSKIGQLGLTGLALATFWFTPANSAIINNQNTTGFVSPTVINFDPSNLYPDETVITNQFSGVLFGPDYFYMQCCNNSSAASGGFLTPATFTQNQPGSIQFTDDVSAAAFSLRTSPGTTTFSAYLNGSLIETFSGSTNFDDTTGRFYGFSGIVFDEIRMTIAGSQHRGFSLDNLQFTTAVPEPSTWAMMILGFAGVGFMTYRRSRKDQGLALAAA